MRSVLGARSDAQLAEILGYTRGAIHQWRSRGGVPEGVQRRFESLKAVEEIATRMADRRRELGQQVLYEGRCLALFIAPSFDAALRQRFSFDHYDGVLRNYASFFDEISLACAEEVSERLKLIEGNPTDAMSDLAKDDVSVLYDRILKRADNWRHGMATDCGSTFPKASGNANMLHDRSDNYDAGPKSK